MRNIIKNYNETVKKIKKNKSEDNKQKFLIIFRELDIQLNKELTTIISKKSRLGKTLDKEIEVNETKKINLVFKIILK